jgi:hypothetical protein
MTIKSVARETALLYLTMKEAGPLPAYARAMAAADAGAGLARLILDEILEIDHDGGFVSGAQAYELLYGPATGGAPGGGCNGCRQRRCATARRLQSATPSNCRCVYAITGYRSAQRWREAYRTQSALPKRLRGDSGSRHGQALETGWLAVPLSSPPDCATAPQTRQVGFHGTRAGDGQRLRTTRR